MDQVKDVQLKQPDGRPVNVVYDVNRDAFFDYMTELAKKLYE